MTELASAVVGPDHLLTWRAVLGCQALVALVMYGGMVGHFWRRLHWPLRVLAIGAAGVGVYVLAGQVKAYNVDIPFDAYSWVGVVAYTVVIAALLAVRHVERRRTWGD